MRPAIFLDRDGTLNFDRGYVCRTEDFELLPGAAAALHAFEGLGFALVVVTNQSAIGRGMAPREAIDEVNDWMLSLLAEQGVALDGVYVCPHRPDEGCACRKPAPGMLLQAAGELNLDLTQSWMVGDKASDIAAGRAAGVTQTILLDASGQSAAKADFVVGAISDTVRIISESLQTTRGTAAPHRGAQGCTPNST
jgi:D-glycero-D-manno-heptose 1,7-bisphosphate phosphatase